MVGRVERRAVGLGGLLHVWRRDALAIQPIDPRMVRARDASSAAGTLAKARTTPSPPRTTITGQTPATKMMSPVAVAEPVAGSTVIAQALGLAAAFNVWCTFPSLAGSSTYIAVELSGVISHSS